LAVALLGAACSAGATRVDPPVADGGFDAGVADLGLHLDADGLDQGLDAGADDQGTSTDGGPTDDASTDAGVPGCWPGGATELEKYRGLLDCLRAPGTDEQKRVAITTFVAEVQSGGGFPIVTSSQAIFIYVRDPAYDQEDDGLTAEDYDSDR